MKQIAIVTRQMIMGGVERALIGMLKQFDYTKVKVDLYLQASGGELFEEIPKEVSVYTLKTVHIKNAWKNPSAAIKKAIVLAMLKVKKRQFIEQCCLSAQLFDPIKKEYDVAIAYHAPNTVPVFYVMDKMKSKKKILWLHGDLETNAGDTELAIRYHGRYDKVFAVSKSVYDSFLYYHPDMKIKADIFYNYVDIEGMKEKAAIGPTYRDGFRGTRILSIGRLDSQKGFDMAVRVCRKLIDNDFDIKWYICGEGLQRSLLEQMIAELALEDRFILLGNQNNPYSYLNDCDIYVQTSRYEGYCTTTNEARMLCKPVITTDVSGAREQFEDGLTGWITPIDENKIAEKIEWCLTHPAEVKNVSKKLENAELQKNNAIDKIYE